MISQKYLGHYMHCGKNILQVFSQKNYLLIVVISFIIVLLLLTVPADAGVDTRYTTYTSVSVFGGSGGNIPVVLCMWEQNETVNNEDGDPQHLTAGCQLLPEVIFEGTKNVQYYAIVYDEEEGGNLKLVSADVFLPNNEYADGSNMYNIDLKYLGHDINQQNLFSSAFDSGLVKFDSDIGYDAILHRLRAGTADLWYGSATINYCDPAGNYSVRMVAKDNYCNPSEELVDEFEYIPVPAAEFDFSMIDYGQSFLSVNKWKTGNTIFNVDDGLPTVRNIGNVPLKILFEQDDMNFGSDSKGNWNVFYDMRIGDTGIVTNYAPYEEIKNPDILQLCNSESIDFSIHVISGFSSEIYQGNAIIGFEQV